MSYDDSLDHTFAHILHTHAHAHTHSCTLTRMHTHMHAYTYAHTHDHTHAHTHTRTHTHTHRTNTLQHTATLCKHISETLGCRRKQKATAYAHTHKEQPLLRELTRHCNTLQHNTTLCNTWQHTASTRSRPFVVAANKQQIHVHKHNKEQALLRHLT